MRSRSKSLPAEARRRSSRTTARFALLAVVLAAAFFFVLAKVPGVDHAVVAPYLSLVARITGVGLRAAGFDVTVTGHDIHSDRFTAAIDRSCGALEVMAIFLAVTLAFPVSARQRASGALVGLSLLLFANIVRVGVLFVIGSTRPTILDAAHYSYGQAFLLLTAVSIWWTWVSVATRKELDAT